MWPFSKKKTVKHKELSEEQRKRCQRKCGLAKSSLRSCLHANSAQPSRCDSLDAQVVYCHAEVLCLDLAKEHERCFTRVLASKGKEPLSACDVHIDAMKACLNQFGLYPFFSS